MESLLVRPLPSGSLQNKTFESHSNVAHTLKRVSAAFVSLSSRMIVASLVYCFLWVAWMGWRMNSDARLCFEALASSGALPLSVGLGPVAQVVRAHP